MQNLKNEVIFPEKDETKGVLFVLAPKCKVDLKITVG